MKEKFYKSIISIFILYVLIFTMAYLYGYNPFDFNNFVRWDSGLYASISEKGYVIELIENSTFLNGNCGWFPLYPLITHLLNLLLHLNFSDSAFIVSLICTLGLIITYYYLIEQNPATIDEKWAILFYLTSIGSIYLVTAFPMSLCLLMTNLSLYFVLNKKYLLSGIFCFLACTSYSTAFLLCAILGCYLIYEMMTEKVNFRYFLIRVLQAPVLGFMGFVVVQLSIYLYTGNIKAFFLTQAKYGHGIHNPIKTLLVFLKDLRSDNIGASQQSFLSLMFLLLFGYLTYLMIRYRLIKDKVLFLSYLCVLVVYSFLLVMGSGVSPLRQYLLGGNGILILSTDKVSNDKKVLIALILCVCLIMEIKLFFDATIV